MKDGYYDMLKDGFYDMVLDNIGEAVYVLDNKGNFIYVNSAYVKLMNIPKDWLLNSNVHDLLDVGMIDLCISDIVFKQKRRIAIFQDQIFDNGVKNRLLVSSQPIFNQDGEINNIISTVKTLDSIDEDFAEASKSTDKPELRHVSSQDGPIIAESPKMIGILSTAELIAAADTEVLISGESGTGKEIIAQYIYNLSARNQKPLVVINCAALPENLLEAELFGYEKGAFTGASSNGKAGLIEKAAGGVLFLDEINSMPIAMQGKLLRAIESKQIRRVGAVKDKNVDFRLIATSNEDLQTLIEKKLFRSDLYYRLNVLNLHIPPLRERTEDIIPLTLHYLKHYCRKYGKKKVFTQNAISTMLAYDWPGNVRELKNFIERSVIMNIGDYIEIADTQKIADSTGFQFNPAKSDTHNNRTGTDYKYEQLINEGTSLKDYISQCASEYVNYSLSRFKSTYKAAEALNTSQSSIIRIKKRGNP